jgi:hypothetical protein
MDLKIDTAEVGHVLPAGHTCEESYTALSVRH